jgi:hypothetical protein
VRALFNTTDGRDCTPSAAVCIWKAYFTTWGKGYVSDAEIKGAAPTDITGCQSDVISLTTSVLNVGLTAQSSGAIE